MNLKENDKGQIEVEKPGEPFSTMPLVEKDDTIKSSIQILGVLPFGWENNVIFEKTIKASSPDRQIKYLMSLVISTNEEHALEVKELKEQIAYLKKYRDAQHKAAETMKRTIFEALRL